MFISFREKLLVKLANNPNQYPWNASTRSNENPKDGSREVEDNKVETLQTIINIPIDKKRKVKNEDMPFINWEAINLLGDNLESNEEKGTGDANKN